MRVYFISHFARTTSNAPKMLPSNRAAWLDGSAPYPTQGYGTVTQASAATGAKNTFCAKLCHTTTELLPRYQRSTLFRKLVAYCYPDCTGPDSRGRWPRPFASPFPCFQCHRKFDGVPVFSPKRMLDGVAEETGHFCSLACAARYMETNERDALLHQRLADLHEIGRAVYGFKGKTFGTAPHFSERKEYGGDLDDDAFAAVAADPAMTTRVLHKPYIPSDTVVEWRYEVDMADMNAAQAGALAVAKTMGAPPPDNNFIHRPDVAHMTQHSKEEIMARQRALPPLARTCAPGESLFDKFVAMQDAKGPGALAELGFGPGGADGAKGGRRRGKATKSKKPDADNPGPEQNKPKKRGRAGDAEPTELQPNVPDAGSSQPTGVIRDLKALARANLAKSQKTALTTQEEQELLAAAPKSVSSKKRTRVSAKKPAMEQQMCISSSLPMMTAMGSTASATKK